MAEFLTNEDKRSCYCGEVSEEMIGKQVELIDDNGAPAGERNIIFYIH